MRSKFLAVTATAAVIALAGSGTVGSNATASQRADRQNSVTAAEQQRVHERWLQLGLQTAPKHKTLPSVKVGGVKVNAVNPFLGLVPDPTTVDWSYWADAMAAKSARSATTVAAVQPPAPFAYDEQEPPGEFGFNDTHGNAERIGLFGRGAGKRPAVRVLGELSPPDIPTDDLETTEDQGAIPIATDTEIPEERDGVAVSSVIGDGPFGGAEGSGDFDFFKLTAGAGDLVAANTEGSAFDTILILYDATGEIVALDDDGGTGLLSNLRFRVADAGDYYLLVTGYLSLPEDPFDSSSGTGSDAEGPYDLELTVGPVDSDYYAVKLNPGDVLGGTISGAATDLVVNKFDGEARVGSQQDLSFIYPSESRLPGGGSAVFAYVAEEAGWYVVSTREGDDEYQLGMEVYRPGSERAGSGAVQRVFLDFDGARVNTGIFGGSGVSTLSPLSTFLGRWSLTNDDLDPLIDQVIATVRENLRNDLVERGLNADVRIRILNSRDHPDRFGADNVSRVIVGGTIAQSGVSTIGIAQSIDPGNYGHEETALVLLDILSSPDVTDDASLNAYIEPQSDKVGFVGTALGNVVSHEIGHYVGSFHVDQLNDVLNLMDQGGNFPLLYGVGEDGVGGTADDPDVDFDVDTYNPNEGFTGLEHTLNNTAWAFRLGQ